MFTAICCNIINMKKIKKPEIMSPIRDWGSLEACKDYADAVYFGVSMLTMRANANTFNLKNIGKFVKKCHEYKIKAYLTVNTVIYNGDIKEAEKVVKKAKEAGVDALIVWDPAVIQISKKYKQKFFISTQANISNWESTLFYKKLGASRVVLSREMTLKQIQETKKKLGSFEIETFVHGAMCVSISGRCLLSAYLYGKSANCGSCAQPCRKEWFLTDGEGNKIANEGKYFLNAKDLCMIEYVPELIKSGISSFKIEGRRRDPRYIEVTSRCYREAVDACFAGTFTKEKAEAWKKELAGVYNRGFSTGFYFGEPGPAGISYDHTGNMATTKKVLLGRVSNYFAKLGVAELTLDHKGLKVGDSIVIEGNDVYFEQKVGSLEIDSKSIKKAQKGDKIAIKMDKKVKKNNQISVLVDII